MKTRYHDQSVVIEHHGRWETGERGVEHRLDFTKGWNAKNVEMLPLQVVDVMPIGLDKIRFVNTGFLVVGAREILSLDPVRLRRSRLSGVAALCNTPVRSHCC